MSVFESIQVTEESKYLDLQTIFDRVTHHLLTQKRQAKEDGETPIGVAPTCKYRTSDGLKCAIGCLVTDQYYSPEMEGISLFTTTSNADCFQATKKVLLTTLEKSGINIKDDIVFDLLDALQRIHDLEISDLVLNPDFDLVKAWEKKLRTLASDYGLQFNFCSNS